MRNPCEENVEYLCAVNVSSTSEVCQQLCWSERQKGSHLLLVIP